MDTNHIFLTALERPAGAERTAFIEQSCAQNQDLRRSIDTILAVHDSIGDPDLYSTPSHRLSSVEEADLVDALPSEFLEPSDHLAAMGRLHEYEALRVVGIGGMSIVLEGFDTRLSRIVAIKVLDPACCRHSSARKRFERESRAIAMIDHPNVAKIFSVGQRNMIPYLVMEYVQGRSLGHRVTCDGPLPILEVVGVAAQVARGLAAIHQKGLLHRDLKPDNVLLESGGELAKIVDFGVAKSVGESGLTNSGEVNGTPEFMAPEQARGVKIDYRADLFSLGAMMYFMASGESPFEASSALASMRRVCDDTPRPVQELNAEVPHWMANTISRLLEKDPQRRLQSVEELAEILEKGASVGPAPQQRPLASRRRSWIVNLTLLLVAAVLFFAVFPLVMTRKLTVSVEGPAVEVNLVHNQLGYLSRRLKVGSSATLSIAPGSYEMQVYKDEELLTSKPVIVKFFGESEIFIDSAELIAEAQRAARAR